MVACSFRAKMVSSVRSHAEAAHDRHPSIDCGAFRWKRKERKEEEEEEKKENNNNNNN